MMTTSGRFGDWFLKFNGMREALIEEEGYFFYESRKVRGNRFVWVVAPIMAAAGFTFAWFAQGEPLAFWFGIVFGLISAVVIPVSELISSRREQYALIEIKNGVLRWECEAMLNRGVNGTIELKDCTHVEVEMDHEGVTSGISFTCRNGEVEVLPRSFATIVMARGRKPFVKAVRYYNPDMFEELKQLYNAKPQGWS